MFEDLLEAGGANLRILGTTNITPIDDGLPPVADGASWVRLAFRACCRHMYKSRRQALLSCKSVPLPLSRQALASHLEEVAKSRRRYALLPPAH